MTAPTDDPGQVLAGWAKAIDDIMADIHWLRAKRAMFKKWQQVVIANPALQRKPQDFLWFIDKTHAADAATAIRRQAGADGDEVSLHRLMIEVRALAARKQVTAEWWMAIGARAELRSATMDEYLSGNFREHFGSEAEPSLLDVRRVQADLGALTSACEPIARFATARVAHALDDRPVQAITWTQIDRSVEILDELSRRYFLLLRCASFAADSWYHEPDPDWPTIFDVPWAKSTSSGPSI